jgi:glucans biosynthesis protein
MVDRLILVVIVFLSFTCWGEKNQTSHTPAPVRARFSDEVVIKLAQNLAASPCTLPQLPAGSPLPKLNYDQYRDIHNNRSHDIWDNEPVPFRVELLPAGFIYNTPVQIFIVEKGISHEMKAIPEMFTFDSSVSQIPDSALAFSGFRVLTHLNSDSVWDECIVFQGASYFRAVARKTNFGLSARGLAIHTAQQTGEEFPVFTRFWIERPARNATGIAVHALLDSRSVAGAYRFLITPGVETTVNVDLTLFPRTTLDTFGIAALTSMFLFGPCDRCRVQDYRDAVHDSEGLLVVSASGEHTWRALTNPSVLQISSFTSEAPKGFGLIQRSRMVSDYQDFEAKYDRRPSAWIEPKGNWGAGSVTLVEIPSDREFNDNIVAFWQPKESIPAGQPWKASYQMMWNTTPRLPAGLGTVTATRCGPLASGRDRLFVIDFDKATGSKKGLQTKVTTSGGKLKNIVLQNNPLTLGVRASFELDPEEARVADLRLQLMRGARPASETWLYLWTIR